MRKDENSTSSRTAEFRNVRKKLFILSIALAAIAFGAFFPVLDADFVNYDDGFYVTANPFIQSGLSWKTVQWAFTSGYAANWHPLTWLSHALDVQLFGLNARGHHFVNLFFHVMNSILLLVVLHRMTGAIWRSAIVAGLFVLHPLHVESVAWVSERKDVLSGFFFLLTVWAYVRFADLQVSASPARQFSAKWYALALSFFALGLMSKPMLVTVPFVLLLLDFWPLRRFGLKTFTRLFVEKIPFFALTCVIGVVTFFVQNRGGALEMTQFPLLWRIENALLACVCYVGKTFWPTRLAVFYPHPGQWPLWQIAAAIVVLLVLTGVVILRARKNPFLAVGWFWFVGMLVPVSGIIQVGMQSMADRYTYLPLTGLFISLVWGVAEILRRYPRVCASFAGTVLAICTILTFFQTRVWRNSETLSQHALKVTAKNEVAEFSLAIELGRQSRFAEAIPHYLEVLKIKPTNADACNNLAECFLRTGDTTNAMLYASRALELRRDFSQAHFQLANARFLRGELAEAVKHYQDALALNPGFAEARLNLAQAQEEFARTNAAPPPR